MIAIDVHMCIRPNDDAPRLGSAIDSTAREAITLHRVYGPEPLPEKIRGGFSLGSADWCSWADSDDLVLPGAFAAVRHEIDVAPGFGLYFTGERWFGDAVNLPGRQCAPFTPGTRITLEQILQNPLAAHHLCVIRRSLVHRALSLLDPLPHVATAWAITAVCAALGGFHQVPFEGYAWRIHSGNTCMQWTDADLFRTQQRIFEAIARGRVNHDG